MDGVCGGDCTPTNNKAKKVCKDNGAFGEVWWADNCGNLTSKIELCSQVQCVDGVCGG